MTKIELDYIHSCTAAQIRDLELVANELVGVAEFSPNSEANRLLMRAADNIAFMRNTLDTTEGTPDDTP